MSSSEEIKIFEDTILNLEDLKAKGILPSDQADTIINALRIKHANQVDLRGEGAIALGEDAKAVGKNGVLIEGDFQGNIYMGKQPENEEQALLIYRRMVMQMTSSLPLRGVDIGSSDATQIHSSIGLANVYIDLDTTNRFKSTQDNLNKFMPLMVMEEVIRNKKLVLLGNPGGGKSTFINYLSYCLAANEVEPQSGWMNRLMSSRYKKEERLGKSMGESREFEKGVLPILVTLRDFARANSDKINEKPRASHLWNFIEDDLKSQNLAKAINPILETLEMGNAILFFDGLDEVQTEAQRIFVRDAVRAFVERYSMCRYLITCRILSYSPPLYGKPDLRMNEFPAFEIAEFDDEKILRFVDAWYLELLRIGTVQTEEMKTLAPRLREAVQRVDLKRLASNPLLLTVMALVHAHKGRLPDARALLYEEVIEILLWRWEQIKMSGRDDIPVLRKFLMEAGRTDIDLKRILREVAFQAHQSVKPDEANNSLGDIDENLLIRNLSLLKRDEQSPDGDLNWAKRVVDFIRLRAGLLLEKQPGNFTFPHRTFQEYLAGSYLASQNNFSQLVLGLIPQKTLWREVVLHAIGKLVYVSEDLDKPLALIAALCPVKMEDDDLSWWRVWLSGDALLEIGVNRAKDSALGCELLMRVQNRLVQLLEKGKLSAQERSIAGVTLSHLGDIRFNPDLWCLPNEELLGFVHVSSGPFLMGSIESDGLSKDAECPQHETHLPDYWIGKYPVTVEQFRIFVKATEYPFRDWKFNQVSSHPVISVSWYDAKKYTEWLHHELVDYAQKQIKAGIENSLWSGLVKGSLYVSLPSEAEWEKAARGDDGRIYPWPGVFDAARANTKESNLGGLTVVGCFTNGASPYQVYDMCGNTWEWTRSLWGKDTLVPLYGYPYDVNKKERENLNANRDYWRLLRGGSFDLDHKVARCAYRFRLVPDMTSWFYGFRIAISPQIV